jgi:hypothetical protein
MSNRLIAICFAGLAIGWALVWTFVVHAMSR